MPLHKNHLVSVAPARDGEDIDADGGYGDDGDEDLNSSCCHFLCSLLLSRFLNRGLESSVLVVQALRSPAVKASD